MNSILKSCLVACIVIFTVSCSNNDDGRQVNPATLPDAAKIFLTTNFPAATIRSVERENERPNGSVYDVTLSNGVEIDFDANGNWIEIDGKTNEIPASLVPEKVKAYVTANYPGLLIVKIENERVKYDVELSNGIDLVFTSEGDFVRIDFDGDNDNEIVVDGNTLPDAAKAFLSTHFPLATIRLVEKEYSARPNGSVYDVTLSNGFEIDFDANGNWTEIDGNRTSVPAAIIPERIQAYIALQYPALSIVKIDKEHTGYDVELSNDLDLLFSLQGDFIRIDY